MSEAQKMRWHGQPGSPGPMTEEEYVLAWLDAMLQAYGTCSPGCECASLFELSLHLLGGGPAHV